MFSNRLRDNGKEPKNKSTRSIKDKKLSKLIASDSDAEGDSEHELSYYVNDRVKLMKEVLKIIKPRKIKTMAPDCMKDMDLQEINSMLLEELLGISNKRLKYIFEGKILDEESSTDEDQPIDVISLDDISDDDFVVISDEEPDKRKSKHKRKKIKEEPTERVKKMKKEKPDKDKNKEAEKLKQKSNNADKVNSKEKETIGEENLMSVLELLELQARARAIRSQLELENKKKQEEQQKRREEKRKSQGNEEDDDEVIMEVPQDVEIVITSSDSENEGAENNSNKPHDIEQSSSSSPKNVSEYANQASVQTNEDSTQEELKSKIQEDGESNGSLADKVQDENAASCSKSDSDSSSNDNLQVVMEREIRKKQEKNISSSINSQASNSSEANDEAKRDFESTPNEDKQQTAEQSDNDVQPKSSRIETAIQDFMKTQPLASENLTDPKVLEEQANTEAKTKRDKERRLKGFKNKLQSFMQDVAVESISNVTVLENIIIKPRAAEVSLGSRKSIEHSDGLVLNVDQDDLDCIICD